MGKIWVQFLAAVAAFSSSRRHARRFKMKLFKEVKKPECYIAQISCHTNRQKNRDSNAI
jgi:hypothetical protein